MKNTKRITKALAIIIFIMAIFISCEENINNAYGITFINTTDFTLTVAPYANEFDTFTINPGEEKTIKTERRVIIPQITGHTVLYSVTADITYGDLKTYTIKQTKKQTYEITFINNTDYRLEITSKYQTYEDFIIQPGETKLIEATSNILFNPNYEEKNGDYEITEHIEGETCTFEQALITEEPDTEENSAYLSKGDYDTLITSLASETSIDREKIDNYLEAMKVSKSYKYSYYASGEYICHSMTWSRYSTYSYDWIYWVSVDIWVTSSGNLIQSMCTYYSE